MLESWIKQAIVVYDITEFSTGISYMPSYLETLGKEIIFLFLIKIR